MAWFCLNNAFVSVVEDFHAPGNLLVRARRRSHLVNLFGPQAQIIKTPRNDYRYRISVPKAEVAKLISDQIMAINYGNFKNSVEEDELHDLYADFWVLHFQYQK